MKKPELLLPAGNSEKLRFALMYGADSVYLGGKIFSLRAQASNFTINDIEEGTNFAHSLGKKVYVTVNVIPRYYEMNQLISYLKELEKIKVDGIIVSDPAVLNIAKVNTDLHISVSTQMSVSNSNAVNFFYENGAKRVVLARELSLDEIGIIKNNTKAELEVFIHGGMCSAYSGRCTLSNYLSLRDANGGGCAHSCRWNYDLYKGNQKLNKAPFLLGSKDLSAIPYIKTLMVKGIDSLKVEGRMKSVSYVATVAYTYRHLIDDIFEGKEKEPSYYESLLGEAMNRESSSGFFDHMANENETLYKSDIAEANQGFYGIVLSYDNLSKEGVIEVRNYFEEGDSIEILSPTGEIIVSQINDLRHNGIKIESAKRAMEHVTIRSELKLTKYDIIRRKLI